MNWIKSKVVMLPTEKATIIYKFEETNKLIFSNHPNQHELATPKHLYFTSNEKIKECDWIYNILSKEFVHYNRNFIEYYSSLVNFPIQNYRKIIATTDKSLGLPAPSKGFLEVYVDAYNEGKKIEEVLVEMEDFGEEDWAGDDYTGEPIWRHDWRVKVKPDNTITIKKVKDSWNREEVIELLNQILELGMNTRQDQITGYCDKSGKLVLTEWIEQNL